MTAKRPVILDLAQIEKYLPHGQILMSVIEEGFMALAAGKAVVPPVGELVFESHPVKPISNMVIFETSLIL